MKNLVSTDGLASRLGDVRVVDGSWYMPGEQRDAAGEFETAHIPGAVFFDIDAISDPATGLPHMLPTPDAFAAAVGALGIGDDDTVVVYDGAGVFSAPRVWWMFKAMGHNKVMVLDGGFPKWRQEGRAVEAGAAAAPRKSFTARRDPALIRDFAAVRGIVADKTAQMIDARSPGRFTGSEAEPRAGIRGGHMPGAANVHFRKLLTAAGTFKSAAEMRALFEAASVDLQKPVVTTCGSGVSAAILLLALDEIGAQNVALYDGSWMEWGAHADAPVEKSAGAG